jgi:hypothetical protein
LQNIKVYAKLIIIIALVGALSTPLAASSLTTSKVLRSSGQIINSNVTANSGSAEDIQAAIDEAVALGRDSVYIPEGTWNFVEVGEPWKTVVVPCGINIFGASTERDADDQVVEWETVLVMPYEAPEGSVWFKYEIDQSVHYNTFRFSNIKLIGWRYFDHGSTTMYTGVSVSSDVFDEYPTAGVKDFRVDHCNFQDMAGSAVSFIGGETDLHNRRVISGVIDHNRFVNSYGDIGFMRYEERTLDYAISMRRWACDVWEPTSEVWGHYTDYTVVIEDNYFSKWRHATCSNDGVHQIVRYNTFDGSYGHGTVDGHGSYAGGSRPYAVGTRCMEVYNNRFLNYDDTWDTPWVIGIRGGSVLVYNNYLDGSYQYLLDLNNDQGNYDVSYCAISDTYIWNNQLNGASIIHYNRDSVQNEDYFLNSPSSYTPYVYPHPLTH